MLELNLLSLFSSPPPLSHTQCLEEQLHKREQDYAELEASLHEVHVYTVYIIYIHVHIYVYTCVNNTALHKHKLKAFNNYSCVIYTRAWDVCAKPGHNTSSTDCSTLQTVWYHMITESCDTAHTSHVILHKSCDTAHTSHVILHKSCDTAHTSHVILHTQVM